MKKRTAWVLVAVRRGRRPGRGRRGRAGAAAARRAAAAAGVAGDQLPRPRPDRARSPRSRRRDLGDLPRAAAAVAAHARREPRPRRRATRASRRVVVRVSSLPDVGLGQGAGAARRASRASASPASPPTPTSSSAATRSTTSPPPATKIYAVPTAHPRRHGPRRRGHLLPGHPRQARRRRRSSRAWASTRTRRTSSPRRASPSRTASRWRRCSTASTASTWRPSRKAAARPPEEVQALVDDGPYDGGDGARRPGLVDELLYEDELDERLKGAEEITPGRYVKASRGFGFDGRPKIALVYAVGEIVPGESQDGPFGGSFAGSDTVAGALRAGARGRRHQGHRPARRQPRRLGHRLRRDLARGGAGAQEASPSSSRWATWRPPAATTSRWAATRSWPSPGTITGSIGVFGGKFSLRGPLRQDRPHQGDPDARRSTRPSSASTGPGRDEERGARSARSWSPSTRTSSRKAAEGRARQPRRDRTRSRRAASGPARRR